MPKILISYRRSDTAGIAGRIFDRLVARFGRDSIFMDVDHIPFGIDFRDHIRETLLAGDILLAIVGPLWLGPRDGQPPRMHDANDPVRVEIETALQHRVALIPVLVDSAPMPAATELPEPLRPFSFLNAAPVDTGRDFHPHMDRLIRTIERALEAKGVPLRNETTGTTPAAAEAGSAASSGAPTSNLAPWRKWLMAAAIAAVAVGVGTVSYIGLVGGPAVKSGAPPAAFVPPSGSPIRIGVAIVESGPAAAQGKEALLGMKIWQEDTNARSGLLGRPVELVHHDDEGNPSNVAGLYARLLDLEKVDLVVSGWPAFLVASAMPVVMQRNKLFLGLLGQGANSEFNYPRYFSMSPTGSTLRGVLTRGLFDVALAQNPRPRSVAISAVDEASCQDVTEGARDQARAAGIPVVYDDTFADSTTDFAPLVRAMAAKNPDLVVSCIFGGDAIGFVRAVNALGFRPKLIGGAMPGLLNNTVKAELGPLLNGWINFEYGLPVPKLQFEGTAAVLSRYRSRARDEDADPAGQQFALWSYARMQVLQQAIEATKSIDDTRLADYIRNATFKTVIGDVRFGDKGEWAEPRILQVQFQNLRDNDVEQFRDLRTQVVVDPPAYRSGNLIYPFADAQR